MNQIKMKHFNIILFSVNWLYLNENVFAILELADLFTVHVFLQL